MPIAYSADALVYDTGTGSWSVRSDFDALLHRVDIAFTDDDGYLDGDVGADEVGSDTGQTGVVTDLQGNTLATGQIYDEEFYAVSDGINPTIWIERIEINGQLVGYLVSEPLDRGTAYTQTATGDVDAAPTATTYDSFQDVPCFAPGTMIATIEGNVPVEWLREGAQVITRDHGFQPIRWIGRYRLTRAQMDRDARLRPVEIAADAFAPGAPSRPLQVSGQHRLLLSDPLMALTFGFSEALCPAKYLAPEAVPKMVGDGFTYYHLLLDNHELIQANGLWTESLFAGERAGRIAIAAGLTTPADIRHEWTARPCLRGWEMAMLARLSCGAVRKDSAKAA